MFHFPVSEEEVPDYRSVIHKPMDMATVLQRVDSGQYLTRAAFMNDIDLIVSNAKVHLLENLFFDSCYICGGLSGECAKLPLLLLTNVCPIQTYNGNDYNGSRIVSRACELRDVVSCLFSISSIFHC